MKPQKLSYKEYKELLDHMRRWVDPYRKEAAKLVYHIQFQAKEIRELEDRVKTLEQEHLFKKAKDSKTEFKVNVGLPKLPQEKWPLPKRLAHLLETKGADSVEFLQSLKWNKLSLEQALDLIKTHKNTT